MAKKKSKKKTTKKAAKKNDPQQTAARGVFEKNAARAEHFLEIHKDFFEDSEEEDKKKRGAPTAPYRELPRAAVVFAVGALDAYLSEVSAEVMVKQLQAAPGSKEAKSILKRVQAELPGLALEVSLLSTQQHRTDRIQQAITQHFHDHVSNHGPQAVSATVGRIGGNSDRIWATIDLAWPKSRQLLQDWTDARHRIVHQGKSERIRRPEADDCIKLIRKIVKAVDAESLKASAIP